MNYFLFQKDQNQKSINYSSAEDTNVQFLETENEDSGNEKCIFCNELYKRDTLRILSKYQM